MRQSRGTGQKDKRQDLIDRGLELLPEEHGGAALDSGLIQELPVSFKRLKAKRQQGIG